MNDLEHLLRRISDSIEAGTAFYQIWFTLRGKGKALPDFFNDMNDDRYVDFFCAINPGTYMLMLIELGCLFDSDPRSASIRNLKSKLAEIGRNDLVMNIDNRLSPYTEMVKNILIIRSKLIAHKELGVFSEDIHSKSGIIPDTIKDLLTVCCLLINDLHEKLFRQNGVFCAAETERFENATFKLLSVLREGRS